MKFQHDYLYTTLTGQNKSMKPVYQFSVIITDANAAKPGVRYVIKSGIRVRLEGYDFAVVVKGYYQQGSTSSVMYDLYSLDTHFPIIKNCTGNIPLNLNSVKNNLKEAIRQTALSFHLTSSDLKSEIKDILNYHKTLLKHIPVYDRPIKIGHLTLLNLNTEANESIASTDFRQTETDIKYRKDKPSLPFSDVVVVTEQDKDKLNKSTFNSDKEKEDNNIIHVNFKQLKLDLDKDKKKK